MSFAFRGLAAAVCLSAFPCATRADEPAQIEAPAERPAEQAMEDAWWTGPMLAAGAGTMPKGHWLVEPYLFDVRSKDSDSLGSLTYINYGLTDRLTVGAIPTFFYGIVDDAPNSSGVRWGDLQLQAQYGLTKFRKGSWVPTTSLVVQQTFPTGKHDRLDGRGADGFGGGAYATTLGYYAQTYWWAPSGRIARFRLNTTATLPGATDVRDDSVYGTPVGFRGRAKPGATWSVNGAVEYSVTRNWVLAMDVLYRHDEPTKVSGVGPAGELVRYDTGVHDSFAVAPAVEYNFSPTVGVLLGMRVIPATGGRRKSVTPAVALNMVY
jgi:hypothetical protein